MAVFEILNASTIDSTLSEGEGGGRNLRFNCSHRKMTGSFFEDFSILSKIVNCFDLLIYGSRLINRE